MGACGMNVTDEKSRMPIPPTCQSCMHCETWITRDVERHQCLRGYPMHDSCGWQRDRTMSIAGVGK